MNLSNQKPNELLRYARQERGWSQQRVAEQIGTSEDVISRWERGERSVSPFYQEKLCLLFGKNARELGLLKSARSPKKAIGNYPAREIDQHQSDNTKGQPTLLEIEEIESFFSFGKMDTTWKTLDGDGRGVYLPQHIRSHYIPFPEELPQELQARREHIEQEQAQRKEQGLPSFWNGEIYTVDRFVIGREPVNENMTLDIWFRPSDYYTFLATNMSLKEPDLREKYLSDVDWYEAIPYFSHSFGVSLAVVTSDGNILFTQRGKNVGTRPRTYETGVVEGLSRPIDRGTNEEAPDVYRCACRGLAEELGLQESLDFSLSDITFLSFGVDTRYSLRGLTGIVKIKSNMERLTNRWKNGVRDKFENQKLFSVPFTPKDVIAFAYTHQPFAPGPTIYYALVHEFGHSMVEEAFDQLASSFVDM